MTAEEGASATDTMVVHNTAAGRLTFDIKRALPDSRALPKAIDSLLGKASANTRNARSTTSPNCGTRACWNSCVAARARSRSA
jgi:hypothetical protein